MYDRNMKLRLLAVERILSTKKISVQEIIARLKKQYNITANRKTIYDDLNCLTYYLPIVQEQKGRTYLYFLDTEN